MADFVHLINANLARGIHYDVVINSMDENDKKRVKKHYLQLNELHVKHMKISIIALNPFYNPICCLENEKRVGFVLF